jgi:hypothetical protein
LIGEVVRELVRELDTKIVEQNLGDPFLSSHNYRPHPLRLENFNGITRTDSERRLAFIDGGNQELVGAPNFSVQLNRAYFNIFNKRRMIQPVELPSRIEFLSATIAKFEDGKMLYNTSLFPMSGVVPSYLPDQTDLSFDSADRSLMVGNSRADIGRVASIARRFAEWRFAQRVVEKELDKGDVLVMDGTLRTAFANESKYAKAAYHAAYERGTVYSGLSKTSRLFTTTGLSLLGAVRRLALDNVTHPVWYYYPIAESLSPEHEAAIFLLKLSDMSKRIFRYEINAEQVKTSSTGELNEIFTALSQNSNDLTFPGYPYGLIDADDNARVRTEELEMYRVMLLSEISKLGSATKFQRHMESMDAHGVMNLLKEAA